MRIPGLQRLSHGVYVASDPQLMEGLARSRITFECCLRCNVVTGAVAAYEERPIRHYAASGVHVTLNTDDPVRVCTAIVREYAVAAMLGFSPVALPALTRYAVVASFTSDERQSALLDGLEIWSG